jgi:hypothetical protein
MLLRRLIPILVFALALPIYGLGQEKVVKSVDKTLPSKVLLDNQQNKRADMIKSVPIADKTMQAIRLQNRKATMEQMHTINKAIRKSMTVRKHK